MSHTLANLETAAKLIAKDTIIQLENKCIMARLVHRAHEREWKQRPNGWAPGQTISIAAPHYARVKEGRTLDVVDINTRMIDMALGDGQHVGYTITADQLTWGMDYVSEAINKPAAVALADYVDRYVMNLYKYVPTQVGTPNSTPSSLATFLGAQAFLTKESVPTDGRYIVVDPDASAAIMAANTALYNDQIAGEAIRGKLTDRYAGGMLFESSNVPRHTPGTWVDETIAVDDAGIADGDTVLNLDSDSTYTVKQGDVFTIADTYAVNPVNGSVRTDLRGFVATADTAFAGAGNDLAITNPFGTSLHAVISSTAAEKILPYQTIGTLYSDDDAVTLPGTASTPYTVNMAFHKDAFALACVPIAPSLGRSLAQHTENYNGLSLTVSMWASGTDLSNYIRFDILIGAVCLNPFMACRIAG